MKGCRPHYALFAAMSCDDSSLVSAHVLKSVSWPFWVQFSEARVAGYFLRIMAVSQQMADIYILYLTSMLGSGSIAVIRAFLEACSRDSKGNTSANV